MCKHFPHYIGQSVAADYSPETEAEGLGRVGYGGRSREFRKKDMQYNGQRWLVLAGTKEGKQGWQKQLGKNKDRRWIAGKPTIGENYNGNSGIQDPWDIKSSCFTKELPK